MLRLAGSMVLILAAVTAAAAMDVQTEPPPTAGDLDKSGREFLDLLVQGRFSEAAARFDETMKSALPRPKLEATWEAVLAQAGSFQGQAGVRTEKVQGYDVAIITCRFELATLDVRVVFDSGGRVSGLFFATAAPSPSGAGTQQPREPVYVDRNTFAESEVLVGDGEWAVPGTLALPRKDGPSPAVVLVHGSGPNDRDETVGASKPFRDLAWGLASDGIAVLRYEKRTLEHGAKMALLVGELTVQTETIDDALVAVRLLRGRAEIRSDAVFVLGHSLGGMVIPRIGEQDPGITGFIVMAGLARPLHKVIPGQLEYIARLDGEISEAESKAIDDMKASVRLIDGLDPGVEPFGGDPILGASARYWLDLRDYRPHEEAKSLMQPLLILQGGRDYQVTNEDFALWRASLRERDSVDFKLYPKLNHLFIVGEGPSSPQEYQTAGNVSPEVIEDIAEWIQSHVPPTK